MIFVSYAREDAPVAAALVARLQAAGQACLIDPPLAQGDVFWRDKIARWLAECDLMLALDSPSADASPWVCQERRAYAGPRLSIAVERLRRDAGDAAVAEVLRACPGPSLAGAAPAPHSADPGQRAALRERSERALAAFLSAQPAPAAAEHAGDRAWLARGCIELRQVSDDAASDYLALEPVTNGLYRAFLRATGFAAPPPTWQRPEFAADDLPVTGITWYEAAACAAWCGGTLPAESIWAAAAAGGRHGPRYATADGTIGPDRAHYGASFAAGSPLPARAFAPNAAGFHGMCGNTWDWCATSWGTHRVIRGGGWMDMPEHCTVDARYRNAPIDADCCVGLRIAWQSPDR